MHPLRAILVFIALVFLGGALISPPIFRAVQAIAPAGSWLARQPYHLYFGRAVQVIAVLGLWPFLRALRMRSWADLGLVRPAGQGRKVAAGFALGFASLAIAAILGPMTGARGIRTEMLGAQLAGALVNAAAGAALVSVLEEALFRGALFGALRRAWPWPAALAASSGFYALLHFFAETRPVDAPRWYSGLVTLGQMFGGFLDGRALVPGFFNLMLAGAILALAYQRSGNLYVSIGLHAGWIFWLKTCKALTYPASDRAWLWGTWKLVDGWLALPVLLVVLVVVWRWKPAGARPAPHDPAA